MRILAAFLLAALPALGSAQISGKTQLTGTTSLSLPAVLPQIVNVAETSSASTIAVKFTSTSFATPSLGCGTSPGVYSTFTSKDSGTDVLSSLKHVQIVAGLSPSTTYYCQYTATNGAGSAIGTFSMATSAAAASTPITGLGFSAPASAASEGSCSGRADTFYNAVSSDGNTYLTNDDTSGWQCSGVPALSSANMSLVRLTSLSPLEGFTVNFLPGFGAAGAETTFDSRSAKTSGLFAMAGYLFMWAGGQQNACCGLPSGHPAYPQSGGNLMMSPDKGLSWNNFQEIDSFTTKGKPPSAAMFPSGPTTMGSCTFVMYGPDDGTLGYFQAVNQHDNADAFVYLVCNDGYWNNGNALYLARVPRAHLIDAKASEYQWYVSGDGSLDSGWTSSISGAQPVVSNAGELGEPAVQYIPTLNRYLLLTFYYPGGLDPADPQKGDTTWLGYEAPHPWGPWTLISTTPWPTQGYYNPVPLVATAQSGTTPTVVFTGNFSSGSTYVPYTSTMDIEQ